MSHPFGRQWPIDRFTRLSFVFVASALVFAACGDPDSESVDGAKNGEDVAITDTGQVVDTGALPDTGTTKDTAGANDVGGTDTGAKDVAVVVDAGSSGGVDSGPGSVDVPPTPAHQCKDSADCAGVAGANLCLGPLFCDKTAAVWSCKHKPGQQVTCDTTKDTACRVTACVSATGKCETEDAPKGTPCVDGDACTVDSSCNAGKCEAGATSWCDCKVTADCLKLSKNKCTGALFCDKTAFPYKCRINPTTVVKCAANKDTTCSKNSCDKDTGQCAMKPVSDGTPCDDGSKATINDICKKGVCAAGLIPKCQSNGDCATQEDGNACNGTLFCDKGSGACVVNPATVVTCPSAKDTACFQNTCDKTTGACEMRARPNGSQCDDGDACTAGDACVAGVCKPGKDYTCPCKTNADCMSKDDGDLCNGTYYCHGTSKKCLFNEATKVICPSVDDTACVKAACVPKTGKCAATAAGLVNKACDLPGDGCRTVVANLAKPVTVVCDDANACTQGDECVGTKCVSGTKVCECQSDTECLLQDDGDLCNGVPYCDKTHKDGAGYVVPKCKPNPASKVYCAVGNDTACLKNRCDPKTGKCGFQPVKTGAPCEDGKVCTVKDTCLDGACKPGANNLCDDGDACTQDKCVAGKGCEHPKACNDNKPCTLDSCKDGTCSFNPKPLDGKGCDADDNGCTVNDVCKAGTCTIGNPVPCSVATAVCHASKCISTGAKTFQCAPVPVADGSGCEDGDLCTIGDSCKAGKCVTGAGRRLFVRSLSGIGGTLRAGAIVALKDGGLVVGGQAVDKQKAAWLVARLDGGGTLVKSKPVVSAKFDALAAVSVVAVDGDNLLTAGTINPGKHRRAQVMAWSSDLSTVPWTVSLARAGSNVELTDMLRHPSGGIVVAVRRYVGKATASVVRLTASGKSLLDVTPAVPSLRYRLQLRPGGGYWLGGTNFPNNVPTPRLVALDAAGKLGWSKTYSAQLSHLNALAGLDGDVVAVGAKVSSSGSRQVALRVAADGSVGWATTTSVPGNLYTVHRQGDLFIAGGGAGTAATTLRPSLTAFGAHGHVAWHTELSTANWRVTALASHFDGTLVGVGVRDHAPVSSYVFRLSAWGQSNCKAAGPCASKKAAACDDKNVCTNDFCEAASGCIHVAHTGACDDGDKCATLDRCSGGKCAGTVAAKCDDGNDCTDDSCSPKTGCAHKKLQGVPCPDSDVCTTAELCIKGACTTKKKVCNDGDPCTKDSCDAQKGCVAVKDVSHCDDGNVCTVDICSPKTGCGANPAPKGTICDDGDACTVGDVCNVKTCKPGGSRLWERKALIAEVDHKASYPNMVTGAHFMDVAPNGDTVAAKQARGGWAIARYSGSGSAKYAKQEHFGHSQDADTQMSTVVANADGSATYFGPSHLKSDGNNNYYAGLLTVDANGKVLAKRRHGPRFNRIQSGAASLLDRAGKGHVGAIIVKRGLSLSESYRVRVWSVDGSGAARYSLDIADSADVSAHSIAGHDDGGAALSHTLGGRWWLTRYGSTGQQLWRRSYPGGTSQMRRYKDGYLVGGSMPRAGGGNNPWIGTTDSDGALLWSTTVDLGESDHVTALTPMPGGGFMFAGLHRPSMTYGERNCRLVRLSASGAVQWWRSYQGAKPLTFYHFGHKPETKYHADVCTTLRPVPGGGVQAGGYLTDDIKGSRRTGWLFRVDEWGNVSCGETGACRQKKTADCDDKTSCTADTCNAKTGCVNANRTGSCDDGNACTGDGTCKDGGCKVGSARLFETTLGDQANNVPAGIAKMALGRLATIENRLVGTKSTSWVRSIDIDGTERTKFQLKPGKAPFDTSTYNQQYVDSVVSLDDGSTLITGAIATASHPAPHLLPVLHSWSISSRGGVVAAHVHKGVASGHGGYVACQAPSGSIMAFLVPSTNPTSVHAEALARDGKSLSAPGKIHGFFPHAKLTPCVGTSDGRFVVGAIRSHSGPFTMQLQDHTPDKFGKPGLPGRIRNYGDSAGVGAGQSRAIALLARGGGDVVVVGETNALTHGGWDAWLLRVDKELVPRLQRVMGTSADERVVGAIGAQDSDDIFVWGSTKTANNGTDGFLWRLGEGGRKRWGRVYGGAKDDRLQSAVFTGGDGGLALLGETASKGAGGSDLWLLRTTPWGQPSCGLAGTCLAKQAADCDDHDPCTADTCDASAGCKHHVIAGACGERPSCVERFKSSKGQLDWMQPRAEQFAHTYTAKQAQVVVATAELSGQSIAVAQVGADGAVHSHATDGTLLWTAAITGAKTETVTSAVVIGDRLLVGGGSDTPGKAIHGGEDGLVVALDREGRARWQRAWGGKEADRIHALTAGPKGIVFAAGRTKSQTAGSQSAGSQSGGNWDGWVTAANGRDGKLLWSKNLGGKGIDYLHAAQFYEKALYVAGSTRSKGAGGSDGWIARLDATGKLLNEKTFGGSKDDEFAALAPIGNGFMAAYGTTASVGGGDAWYLATNATLASVKSHTWGHKQLPDEVFAAASLGNGRIAVAGSTSTDNQKRDAWLAVLNDDGKPYREHRYGAAHNDYFGAITKLRRGGYLVGGHVDLGGAGTQGWLQRTNPWGFSDCKKAGKCAWNGPTLCDDGLACTIDACDPKTGCTHTGDATKCTQPLSKDAKKLSCKAILKAYPGAASGIYTINRFAYNEDQSVPAFCDMETDGGGWTLVVAIRADIPASWDLYSAFGNVVYKGSAKHQTDERKSAPLLARQGRGDVTVSAALSRDRMQAILNATVPGEILVDTGAGLFAWTLKKANHHGFVFGAHNIFRDPRAVGLSLNKPSVALRMARDAHMPDAKAVFTPITPDFQTSKGCAKASDCLYFPANTAGRFQQAHRRDGAPGAGFDGARRHPVRIYVR